MPELQVALRYVVFAAFAASGLVALASWLVRTRRISPFGALGRTLRTASDPLIRPIETRLVRAGGNPVHAGWWPPGCRRAAGLPDQGCPAVRGVDASPGWGRPRRTGGRTGGCAVAPARGGAGRGGPGLGRGEGQPAARRSPSKAWRRMRSRG